MNATLLFTVSAIAQFASMGAFVYVMSIDAASQGAMLIALFAVFVGTAWTIEYLRKRNLLPINYWLYNIGLFIFTIVSAVMWSQ